MSYLRVYIRSYAATKNVSMLPCASLSCFAFMLTVFSSSSNCELMSIRIVKQPSLYGSYNAHSVDHGADPLTARIEPANFSGPIHLKRLMGRCFNSTINSYKYVLCPFNNVTQHEQSLRWNPYSGVLGVWREWVIANNTFHAMRMTDGDSCGEKSRTVTVYFICGASENVTAVGEPSTCNYDLTFQTRYVCHNHSMLVYPTLDQEHRHKWDVIWGELQRDELTRQGYDKKLTKLFREVGYYTLPKAESKPSTHNPEADDLASRLKKCEEESEKLRKDNQGLKLLLELGETKKRPPIPPVAPKETGGMRRDWPHRRREKIKYNNTWRKLISDKH